MSDWKPMTETELEDYEARDDREELLLASCIAAYAKLRARAADTPRGGETDE